MWTDSLQNLNHARLNPQWSIFRNTGKIGFEVIVIAYYFFDQIETKNNLELLPLPSWHPQIAATGGVLWKKVFLKISQNSQKNICARVSFLLKLQGYGLQLY